MKKKKILVLVFVLIILVLIVVAVLLKRHSSKITISNSNTAENAILNEEKENITNSLLTNTISNGVSETKKENNNIITKENTKDSNKNSQTKEDSNLNNKQTSNNTNNKTDNKINITTNNSNKNDSGTNNNNKNDNNTNNKVDNDNKHPNVDNEGNNEEKKEEQQEEINKDLANKHFTKYNSSKTAHAVSYLNNLMKSQSDYNEFGGYAVAVTSKPTNDWFSYSGDYKLNGLALTGCVVKVYIEDEYRYNSKGTSYYLYDTKAYVHQEVLE